MPLTIDMRRAWVFALALLLFLVAVGPACLLSASSAVAMPGMGSSPKSSDCGGPANSSMSACPHEAESKDRSSASSVLTAPSLPAVLPAATVVPDVGAGHFSYALDGVENSPPPAYLVPLRL